MYELFMLPINETGAPEKVDNNNNGMTYEFEKE